MIKVDECSVYDNTATKTFCLKCNQTHFLSEDNVCTKRTEMSKISGCAELSKYTE